MKQQTLLADDQIVFGYVVLEPGEKRAPEVHAAMSETIVMLRGDMRVLLARIAGPEAIEFGVLLTAQEFGPGQSYVRAGRTHAVENASETEPAEFLAIMRKVEPPVDKPTEKDFRGHDVTRSP